LDHALGKAMDEVANDVEYELEEAKLKLIENES